MQEAENSCGSQRLAFLEAYIAELEQEVSEKDALRTHLETILSEMTDALQSGPLSNDSWSWLGLAQQAEKLRTLLKSAVEVLGNYQNGKRSAGRAAEVADHCKAVLHNENAVVTEFAKDYDWRLITRENLPGFDDLLLQDMNPPYGEWCVSNKHYRYQVSYEGWMRSGFRWYAKMRLPEDWTKPSDGLSAGAEE
jgi:hypothetical protein